MRPFVFRDCLLAISMMAMATIGSADPARCPPTFEARFDDPAEKLEKNWRFEYVWGNDIRINDELQYYLRPGKDGASPFHIADGRLTIEARPVANPRKAGIPTDRRYTSGLLTTEHHFSQRYGRFEIRARLPRGRGLWPAFWLLPAHERWPEGIDILPEIDIMEFLGHQPTIYHTTVHSNQTGKLQSHGSEHNTGLDLSQDFHRYAVEWSQKEIRWYFDDRLMEKRPTPRDLHHPMYLLVNLAVGGKWPGNPDASTPFPAKLEIDWIRVTPLERDCPAATKRNDRAPSGP